MEKIDRRRFFRSLPFVPFAVCMVPPDAPLPESQDGDVIGRKEWNRVIQAINALKKAR